MRQAGCRIEIYDRREPNLYQYGHDGAPHFRQSELQAQKCSLETLTIAAQIDLFDLRTIRLLSSG
jgi:hypothetical protein